jgi:hypothetical protein
MTPLERGEDPVEVKRVVCIPVAKDSGGVSSAVPAGGAGDQTQPGTVPTPSTDNSGKQQDLINNKVP